MQQSELNKLLEAPYAEFERRVRRARLRAAGIPGIDALRAAPAQAAAEPDAATLAERIEAEIP